MALWIACLSMAVTVPANAHEINPTIGDLTVVDGQVTLQLRVNAEVFLAGIDLDKVSDTDLVADTSDYVTLRTLSQDALKSQLWDARQIFEDGIVISTQSGRLALEISDILVSETGDVELPRLSRITLMSQIPSGSREIMVSWPKGFGALILRQQGVDDPYTGYLAGGDSSPAITVQGGDALGPWASFASYVPVGFDHILPKGLDHILFVLGLFFLSLKLRTLLWQVSAFTLAHTVTLAMGALGWVSVPASIVEPLIAASIVYIAVENILGEGLSRWRPFVVFGFGLLHGLGFASVLGEFGLPADQFIPALIGFNVGVELGQLTVIVLAFATVGYWFGAKPWYRARIAIPMSAGIAMVGAYWFFERVFF